MVFNNIYNNSSWPARRRKVVLSLGYQKIHLDGDLTYLNITLCCLKLTSPWKRGGDAPTPSKVTATFQEEWTAHSRDMFVCSFSKYFSSITIIVHCYFNIITGWNVTWSGFNLLMKLHIKCRVLEKKLSLGLGLFLLCAFFGPNSNCSAAYGSIYVFDTLTLPIVAQD